VWDAVANISLKLFGNAISFILSEWHVFLNSGISFSVSTRYMLDYNVPTNIWVESFVNVTLDIPPNISFDVITVIVSQDNLAILPSPQPTIMFPFGNILRVPIPN